MSYLAGQKRPQKHLGIPKILMRAIPDGFSWRVSFIHDLSWLQVYIEQLLSRSEKQVSTGEATFPPDLTHLTSSTSPGTGKIWACESNEGGKGEPL